MVWSTRSDKLFKGEIMNNPDYDPNVVNADQYGNLTPKDQKTEPTSDKYKGFTIDLCIGHVKLWDQNSDFVNIFTSKKDAKIYVDTI